MKLQGTLSLIITTLILITVTVFDLLGFPFGWIFYLTVLGQVFLIVSVYKILTDDYTTDKTFEDFYEDHPIGKEERHFSNRNHL